MKKVLLIGGSGYVGSALYQHWKNKHNITNVDCNWFNSFVPGINSDYNTLTKEHIAQHDIVVLLAGHSSVNMCKGDLHSCYQNNVINFVNLINKIDKQKFIYASSASVYGATPLDNLSETDTNFSPINPYDMTKLHIDQIAQHSDVEYYGLRFGTVNGVAPHWRTDVMINAMTHTAYDNHSVNLFNGDVKRSILGIKDLLRAFDSILDGEDNRGIYNLASFTATSRQIAQQVAGILGVSVTETEPKTVINEKLCNKSYDFGMSTTKFEQTYNFQFRETVETICKGLINEIETTHKTNRNKHVSYTG